MRTLAPRPEVLFLDQSFSALDCKMTLFIREQLQEVFIQRQTIVLGSPDPEEAGHLADLIRLLARRPNAIVD